MAQLRQIHDDVWLADGPTVSFLGFPYPTRMGVVRLPDERLWIWSPVGLDDPSLVSEVLALGTPCYAVEPNKLHHLALTAWVRRFPELQLYAPPGLMEKRTDLRFSAELTDEAPREWRQEIAQIRIQGSVAMTEVIFFHRPSRTCFVGDLIQKHHPKAMSGWKRMVMRADGLVGADGSTPREWRLTFLNRGLAREGLDRVLQWEPERLVIAHGTCAERDAITVLRKSLAWLKPSPDV